MMVNIEWRAARGGAFGGAAVSGGLLPVPAFAAEGAVAPAAHGDIAWVLTASALVLFMTLPGLALFYGGLVRAKNLLSVLMHCFVICCVVSLLWAMIGYSLAFDGDGLILDGAGVSRRARAGFAGHRPAGRRLCAVPDNLRSNH